METQTIKPFIEKFKQLPLDQRLMKMLRFLRGFLVATRFDTKGLIDAGSHIKIYKQMGEIHLDRYATICEGVHLIVKGKSPTNKAILQIGVGSYIGERTIINVTQGVTIGKDCMISWDCDLRDSCWHQVRFPGKSPKPITQPIFIDDHVWIGSHTIIERGVRIGRDSVVAAGSKVIRDILPNSFAAGNPAKLICEIEGWDRSPKDE